MQIELWSLGREQSKGVDEAIADYAKRINRYNPFSLQVIDNGKLNKNMPREQLLDREADLVLDRLQERDWLVALDEHGTVLRSTELAERLNRIMSQGPSRLIFLIGGSYGLAPRLKSKARLTLSLSALTFPHQLVRLLFTEQLYRAFTILRNEKYHHE